MAAATEEAGEMDRLEEPLMLVAIEISARCNNEEGLDFHSTRRAHQRGSESSIRAGRYIEMLVLPSELSRCKDFYTETHSFPPFGQYSQM